MFFFNQGLRFFFFFLMNIDEPNLTATMDEKTYNTYFYIAIIIHIIIKHYPIFK